MSYYQTARTIKGHELAFPGKGKEDNKGRRKEEVGMECNGIKNTDWNKVKERGWLIIYRLIIILDAFSSFSLL